MQTFLPYKSFVQSAKVLDMKRLGKQRVEAYQILRCLTGESNGWRHHPAVKMWKGYELLLAEYGIDICSEWIRRGYKDTLFSRFQNYILRFSEQALLARHPLPDWLGTQEFHDSHKSNLLRKNPEYYSQFNWNVISSLPYVWPLK